MRAAGFPRANRPRRGPPGPSTRQGAPSQSGAALVVAQVGHVESRAAFAPVMGFGWCSSWWWPAHYSVPCAYSRRPRGRGLGSIGGRAARPREAPKAGEAPGRGRGAVPGTLLHELGTADAGFVEPPDRFRGLNGAAPGGLPAASGPIGTVGYGPVPGRMPGPSRRQEPGRSRADDPSCPGAEGAPGGRYGAARKLNIMDAEHPWALNAKARQSCTRPPARPPRARAASFTLPARGRGPGRCRALGPSGSRSP